MCTKDGCSVDARCGDCFVLWMKSLQEEEGTATLMEELRDPLTMCTLGCSVDSAAGLCSNCYIQTLKYLQNEEEKAKKEKEVARMEEEKTARMEEKKAADAELAFDLQCKEEKLDKTWVLWHKRNDNGWWNRCLMKAAKLLGFKHYYADIIAKALELYHEPPKSEEQAKREREKNITSSNNRWDHSLVVATIEWRGDHTYEEVIAKAVEFYNDPTFTC